MLDKLEVRVQEMSQETERLTDTQYNKNIGSGNKDLENAKEAIQVYSKTICKCLSFKRCY